MLQEAQKRKMRTNDGKQVVHFNKLKEFYLMKPKSERRQMYACAIGVFESSIGWMEDCTAKIMEELGWEYDPTTMVTTGKHPGNGLVEKVISRKRSDLRKILRKCCKRGPSKYNLRIVRPRNETRTEDDKYIRRKAGYVSPAES
jgi:hypothetical protein